MKDTSVRQRKKGGHAHAERIYRYVQRTGLASPESVPERYRIVAKKRKGN
jgi:hypothetical protein